jgi:hypothetical protein
LLQHFQSFRKCQRRLGCDDLLRHHLPCCDTTPSCNEILKIAIVKRKMNFQT